MRAVIGSTVLLPLLVAWAMLTRAFAPVGNTGRSRFDAIIVLGTPADDEGNPTPAQLARVTEAVHEYERAVAPRLIVTGGAAHNHFVEAQVMARSAEAMGVPASSIYQEGQAQNTIQNACYAVRLMKEQGWRSAEVISSAAHLPRAGLMFSATPIEWRAHAAPPLEPQSGFSRGAAAAMETLKTLRYLVYGRWADRCQ